MNKCLSKDTLQQIIDHTVENALAIAQAVSNINEKLDPLSRVMHHLWMAITNATGDTVNGYALKNTAEVYREQFFHLIKNSLLHYVDPPLTDQEAANIVSEFKKRVQAKRGYKPDCEHCHGSGFKIVRIGMSDEELDCDCKQSN